MNCKIDRNAWSNSFLLYHAVFKRSVLSKQCLSSPGFSSVDQACVQKSQQIHKRLQDNFLTGISPLSRHRTQDRVSFRVMQSIHLLFFYDRKLQVNSRDCPSLLFQELFNRLPAFPYALISHGFLIQKKLTGIENQTAGIQLSYKGSLKRNLQY